MNRFRIDRGEQHVRGVLPDRVRPRGFSRKEWKGKQKYDPKEYAKFSINIPTPDDFCPTLEDGTVEVSVFMLHGDGKPAIRTCVWGGDDMGFDRDEEFETKAEAKEAIQRRVKEVQGWGIVTKKMLKGLGFVNG